LLGLVRYLGGVVRGTTLFDLLMTLIDLLIPESERTPELTEFILMTRQVKDEPTDDMQELISEEFVLDAFGVEDKQALEKEIEGHQTKATAWKGFKLQFKAWKDTPSTMRTFAPYVLAHLGFNYKSNCYVVCM